MRGKTWKLIGAGCIAFLAYQAVAQNRLVTVRYPIRPAGRFRGRTLPKRIVVVADLHERSFGRGNRRLLAAIAGAKPDMILIPGDLTTRRARDAKVSVAFVRQLSGLGVPIFVSLGNHEESLRQHQPLRYNAWRDALKHAGAQILDNRCVRSADGVAVCGLSLPPQVYAKDGRCYRLSREDTARIFPRPEPDDFCILLAHTPYYAEEYRRFGADLIVSGHLHGGLIRLPKLGGLISPQLEWFPRYDSGIYSIDGSHMAVSRGLGTHFPPIRINNPPELMVLELEWEDQGG